LVFEATFLTRWRCFLGGQNVAGQYLPVLMLFQHPYIYYPLQKSNPPVCSARNLRIRLQNIDFIRYDYGANEFARN
jgi:hypothetical protein